MPIRSRRSRSVRRTQVRSHIRHTPTGNSRVRSHTRRVRRSRSRSNKRRSTRRSYTKRYCTPRRSYSRRSSSPNRRRSRRSSRRSPIASLLAASMPRTGRLSQLNLLKSLSRKGTGLY